MEQLKKPVPPPAVSVSKTSTKPRPKPSKPKDSLALASSNAGTSKHGQAPGAPGPAASLDPALAKPKPRKKPKPTPSISGPSGSVVPSLSAPYQPLAAPGSVPVALHHPSAAPRPVATNPQPLVKRPAPVANAIASTSSTNGTAANRAPYTSGTLNTFGDAMRWQAVRYTQPAVNPRASMPGMQLPAAAHITAPAASSSPAPVPKPALPSTSAASTSAAGTSTATISATTNKRPAADQPEEERKKKKFSACLICNQKPGTFSESPSLELKLTDTDLQGHLVADCPDVQTVERLRNTIQRLENLGEGHEVSLLPYILFYLISPHFRLWSRPCAEFSLDARRGRMNRRRNTRSFSDFLQYKVLLVAFRILLFTYERILSP